MPNAWSVLLDGQDDWIVEAERLVAAAIGADADPSILPAQVKAAVDAVYEPPEQLGQNLVHLLAAVAGIAHAVATAFADEVVAARESLGEVVEDDARRHVQLHLLTEAAKNLRATVAD